MHNTIVSYGLKKDNLFLLFFQVELFLVVKIAIIENKKSYERGLMMGWGNYLLILISSACIGILVSKLVKREVDVSIVHGIFLLWMIIVSVIINVEFAPDYWWLPYYFFYFIVPVIVSMLFASIHYSKSNKE